MSTDEKVARRKLSLLELATEKCTTGDPECRVIAQLVHDRPTYPVPATE